MTNEQELLPLPVLGLLLAGFRLALTRECVKVDIELPPILPCTEKLGHRDSNPDSAVQSRVPYHWTMSQFYSVVGSFQAIYKTAQQHRPEYTYSVPFVNM